MNPDLERRSKPTFSVRNDLRLLRPPLILEEERSNFNSAAPAIFWPSIAMEFRRRIGKNFNRACVTIVSCNLTTSQGSATGLLGTSRNEPVGRESEA